MRDPRVLLIGGTSNAGKSTLALALAVRLGWSCISTDKLGRHPGRPWTADGSAIPAHVAQHYATLPVPALVAEQLAHYERMWPRIEALIGSHARDPGPGRLILEGSGVWPDRVAALPTPGVAAIWLTASMATLRGRIYASSQYEIRSASEKVLIDAFAARTAGYNQEMLAAIARLGLACIDVDQVPADALVTRCLDLAAPGR
jgi:hypothetical protein